MVAAGFYWNRDHLSEKIRKGKVAIAKHSVRQFISIQTRPNNNGAPGLSAHSIRSNISTGGAPFLFYSSTAKKVSINVIKFSACLDL